MVREIYYLYDMRKLLLIALLVCFGQINAQTWVTIPDANFAHYLDSIIPAAAHNDSLNTSSTLVTTTTQTMNISLKGIGNLNGIQYFTSLTWLNCSNNSISNLSTLPNSLTYLDCSYQGNNLTSLPALPNLLNYFDCTYNHINTLPTLPNSLDTLKCGMGVLTVLPALPNSLIYLDCHANNLTTLPVLPTLLTYLECSNNNSLANLPNLPNSIILIDCSFNHLVNLPLLPNSLTFIECTSNYLTSLPVLPNSLTHLDCGYQGNNLTSLPSLPNSLIYLACQYNSLTSLPTLPASLTYMVCSHNNISCFPTFPSLITNGFGIDPNPYNCLPNYIAAMSTYDTTHYPLCAAGNSNGCAVAGIEQFANNNIELNIYPNPNNGSFVIEPNSTTKQTMQVYDVNGKLVLSQPINGKTSIDASSLNEGIYNINLITNEGVVNKRIVIVR